MNTYPHHIGDFNTATRHLSRLERGLYRDMLDMYYDAETALDGSDFGLLARRLLCRSDDELAALQFLLDEYFELQDDGRYIQARCEREIEFYRQRQVGNDEVKQNVTLRKQQSRARRSAIFSALRSKGLAPSFNAKMVDLLAMCREHGVTVTDNGAHVSGGEHVTAHVTACHGDVTVNQNQNQNHINTPQPPRGGECDGLAIASELQGYFPELRRTRTAEVASLIDSLVAGGAVSVDQLLTAAASQSATLSKDDGKACPAVLRWLRESRWLDTPASTANGGGIPSDWSSTRSGVEAMGERLGLGPWDESVDRIFADYEARVLRILGQKGTVSP